MLGEKADEKVGENAGENEEKENEKSGEIGEKIMKKVTIFSGMKDDENFRSDEGVLAFEGLKGMKNG